MPSGIIQVYSSLIKLHAGKQATKTESEIMLTVDVACSFPFAHLLVEAYLAPSTAQRSIGWISFWESQNSSELAVFQDLYVSDVPEDLELHSEILPEGAPKKKRRNDGFCTGVRGRGRERERDVDSANC